MQGLWSWSCTGISLKNVAAVLLGSWKVPCLAYGSWNNCECPAGCYTQRKDTRRCQKGSGAHETVAGKSTLHFRNMSGIQSGQVFFSETEIVLEKRTGSSTNL